jgi:Rieske Fe-S protein
MNRRNFTKTCIHCFSASLILPVLDGCQATHYTTGNMESNGIAVAASEFNYMKKDQEMVRQYIIVRNDALEFPIYLYRFSQLEYSAVLMKCTHQGNELSASGDHLTCSAHGSEFNNRGVVVNGPAEKNLRPFKVSVNGDQLLIDLRA